MYIDPNTLNKRTELAGVAATATIEVDRLSISGQIDRHLYNQYGIDCIALFDGCNRFIAASAVIDPTQWNCEIEASDIGGDNGFLTLRVYACNSRSKFVFPITLSFSVSELYTKFVARLLPSDSRDVPSIAEDLRSLVKKAASVPYVARSIHAGILTGNNYQSLNLGDELHKGGRPSRERLLRNIEFGGKSVLDIGANTGENSRVVRKLGASIVDGYEYDPYFVEIGRAVNAVTGMTRVSLFQGDCTKPDLFVGMRYDLVLAFSVWVYIRKTISKIAQVSDIMVFETHTLDHGINFYYEKVEPYFPHSISLGYVEKPQDPYKSRMLILFGKDKSSIDSILSRQFLRVEPYFPALADFVAKNKVGSKAELARVAAKFFEGRFDQSMFTDEEKKFGSRQYYEMFLAGLHQFMQSEMRVTRDNVYLRCLMEGVSDGLIDPNLKPIAGNEEWMIRKIANKYEDALNIAGGHADRVAPVEITLSSNDKLNFTMMSGETVRGVLDGHHRLFMALLTNVPRFHVVTR